MTTGSKVWRVLVLAAAAAAVWWLGRPKDAPLDPRDVADVLVDAGLSFAPSPVDQALLERRKIVIATDINATSSQRVIASLLLLEAQDSGKPIDLYIRTEGGWVSDAFGIIDVMGTLRSPVNTHAVGGTHSAGAMILAAGTGVRRAYPYSSVMFHAGLYEEDGPYGESTVDNRRVVAFWRRHARLPEAWLNTLEEETYFLGPEKTLEYGLIDELAPPPRARAGARP